LLFAIALLNCDAKLVLFWRSQYFCKKKAKKNMRQAEKSEYPQHKYFSRYIEYSDSQDVIEMLTKQKEEVLFLMKNLSVEQQKYRYAEGKWSIQELLGHITDTERIFSYRSVCIARGEKILCRALMKMNIWRLPTSNLNLSRIYWSNIA
jgi:hypothetical protein